MNETAEYFAGDGIKITFFKRIDLTPRVRVLCDSRVIVDTHDITVQY